MKKVWLNPQLMNLGIQLTNEEEVNENAKIFYKCEYCCERFWTKKARAEHEESCFYKPASPGFGPSGNVTPGLDAVPVS